MKKVIIGVTAVILCLSVGLCGYYSYNYYTYNEIGKLNDKVLAVNNKIDDVNRNVEEKKKEIEQLRQDNEEKVRVLELWQNALNQVKRDS